MLNKMHFTIQRSTGLTPPIQPHFFSFSLYLPSFLYPILSIFLPHTHSFYPTGHSHPFSPLTLKKCTQVTSVCRPLILLILQVKNCNILAFLRIYGIRKSKQNTVVCWIRQLGVILINAKQYQ